MSELISSKKSHHTDTEAQRETMLQSRKGIWPQRTPKKDSSEDALSENRPRFFSVVCVPAVTEFRFLDSFTRRRFIGALAALSAASLARTGMGEEWTLPVLMESLAQVRSARARFVEKRYLSLLRKPIETMGVLVYEAPGRLEKLVHKPKPERLLLEGDLLTLETDNGRKRKVLALAEIPQLAALVGALRATLAGDMQMLVRYFDVSLEGPPDRWRLTLKPMESSSLVKFVRIFGTGVDLTAVEVQQTDGDRSVMLMKKD